LPGLYLGDKDTVKFISRLEQVTHVLSVIEPVKKIDGVIWKGIEIEDHPAQLILKHFEDAFSFIENSNGSVYVHCRAGVSRSATIVIAYIMWKFDLTFEQAFKYVKSRRSQIHPNPGFQAQLKWYELSRGRGICK
jgi:protein-tyrosine phosphatase